MKYLFDATVLRNIAANDKGFMNIYIRMASAGVTNIELSSIAAAENFKAVHNHRLTRAERETIERWIRIIKIAPFDAGAAEKAGALFAQHSRKGKTTPTPDFMIAGQAVHLGYTLVTNNTKHFTGFPGLKLEDWLRS